MVVDFQHTFKNALFAEKTSFLALGKSCVPGCWRDHVTCASPGPVQTWSPQCLLASGAGQCGGRQIGNQKTFPQNKTEIHSDSHNDATCSTVLDSFSEHRGHVFRRETLRSRKGGSDQVSTRQDAGPLLHPGDGQAAPGDGGPPWGGQHHISPGKRGSKVLSHIP